jgi:hypothetical protein
VLLELGEPVREIALHRASGSTRVDVAVMDLAERVVDDATSIGDADLQRLRDLARRRRSVESADEIVGGERESEHQREDRKEKEDHA